MEIKHLSATEMEAHKQEYPESEPKEWTLFDGKVCFGFYDTEQEAKTARDEWNVRTMVEEAFREWAYKTADEIGVDVEKLVEIVKESV